MAPLVLWWDRNDKYMSFTVVVDSLERAGAAVVPNFLLNSLRGVVPYVRLWRALTCPRDSPWKCAQSLVFSSSKFMATSSSCLPDVQASAAPVSLPSSAAFMLLGLLTGGNLVE